jgi:beta-glucosidase-like glycosyl hydrolase
MRKAFYQQVSLVHDRSRVIDAISAAFSEQEHSRTTESSNVDDRTQHEIYAHPFLRSVMAGVTSVMCSYSLYSVSPIFCLILIVSLDLVNNTYACENDKMLNDILKREFGFQGCEHRIAVY